MRGAAWVLLIAAIGGGAVAWLVHTRRGTVDRQLDADLEAALDRGGIGDLGRAQALGRRLVLGGGGRRPEAAALAFADARLAVDYGVATAAEAEEILARFAPAGGPNDGIGALAATARALLAAHTGNRQAAARIAADAAAAQPETPYPLYALGRARVLAGDLAGSMRAFEAAIVVSPTFLPARVARAEAVLDLGNPAAARAALEPVLAESPGDLRAQLLAEEAEAATSRAQPAAPFEPRVCTGERWRPPAIEAECLLARAERARRAGNRAEARSGAEAAARAIPDEPRLLARAALLLAQLGAIDRAAALVARARRLAAPETPSLAWATAAIALGRGRAGALPGGARPADPETALVVARAALAAGGVGALGTALSNLGPDARARDADLERLGRLAAHAPGPAPTAANNDPMVAYLDGLTAQLKGDLAAAAAHFGRALAGHGDACRAAGEYTAALRAQKQRPDPAALAPLRAENSRCVNLR